MIANQEAKIVNLLLLVQEPQQSSRCRVWDDVVSVTLLLLKQFSVLRRLSLRAMSDGPMQLWQALPN